MCNFNISVTLLLPYTGCFFCRINLALFQYISALPLDMKKGNFWENYTVGILPLPQVSAFLQFSYQWAQIRETRSLCKGLHLLEQIHWIIVIIIHSNNIHYNILFWEIPKRTECCTCLPPTPFGNSGSILLWAVFHLVFSWCNYLACCAWVVSIVRMLFTNTIYSLWKDTYRFVNMEP